MLPTSIFLFDFSAESTINNWRVVDDGVMGGRSDGNFYLNEHGHGVFEGLVSLENNGGFSSVRYRFRAKQISAYQTCVLRIKGDGKRYQFRVKADSYDYHSYIHYFQTTGEWQLIEIPLKEMYPTFHGRKLNMPNFPGEKLEEIAFLIGNKRAEGFRLEIDQISLR